MYLPSPHVNTFPHPVVQTSDRPYHQAARRGGIVIVRNPPGEPTFPNPITAVPVPSTLTGGLTGLSLFALDTGHPLHHRVIALRVFRQFQANRRAVPNN